MTVKCSRRNPPEVQLTSGQKPCTKIISIVLHIFLKKIISSDTKRRKQMNCCTSYEKLENNGEMKLNKRTVKCFQLFWY